MFMNKLLLGAGGEIMGTPEMEITESIPYSTRRYYASNTGSGLNMGSSVMGYFNLCGYTLRIKNVRYIRMSWLKTKELNGRTLIRRVSSPTQGTTGLTESGVSTSLVSPYYVDINGEVLPGVTSATEIRTSEFGGSFFDQSITMVNGKYIYIDVVASGILNEDELKYDNYIQLLYTGPTSDVIASIMDYLYSYGEEVNSMDSLGYWSVIYPPTIAYGKDFKKKVEVTNSLNIITALGLTNPLWSLTNYWFRANLNGYLGAIDPLGLYPSVLHITPSNNVPGYNLGRHVNETITYLKVICVGKTEGIEQYRYEILYNPTEVVSSRMYMNPTLNYPDKLVDSFSQSIEDTTGGGHNWVRANDVPYEHFIFRDNTYGIDSRVEKPEEEKPEEYKEQLRVTPGSVTLMVGGTYQMTATVHLIKEGEINDSWDVTTRADWYSNDKTIAKIDIDTGIVTGVSEGKTSVYAYYGGNSNEVIITVEKPAIEA